MITRRAMLKVLAAATAVASVPGPSIAAPEPAGPPRLGVCVFSYMMQWKAARDGKPGPKFRDAASLLSYCHELGAAGLQVGLGADLDAALKLRESAERWGMYLEGQVSLPKTGADVPKFRAELLAVKGAGATVVRTAALSGRRYETFSSAEAFKQFAEQAWQSLTMAEPEVKKQGLKLAVENHKDWRVGEMLDILQRLNSEHVGICVDTGNSIALLEEPTAVVEAYAKFAFSAHLKDMAVQPCDDGFLLSEVPLGEGFLDLRRIIETLRKANPKIQFSLEMITRDPLLIPCLTDKYWATMAQVPGRDLARMLSLVRAKSSPKPLPTISQLKPDEQLKAEDDNVRACFANAVKVGV